MLSEEARKEIMKLRMDGKTYREIADLVGTSITTAHKVVRAGTTGTIPNLNWPCKPVATRMKALGLTVEELSKRSQVKQSAVYRILRGRQDPKIKQAARIAKAVGLTFMEAFGNVVQ